MPDPMIALDDAHAVLGFVEVLASTWHILLVLLGFSLVIFFPELGHFAAAKWCNVKVDKFAIGFGKAICSFRRGIGFRWGSTELEYRRRLEEHVEQKRDKEIQFHEKVAPTDSELSAAAKELNFGETEYCFNALPLGGYVKMLGQDDFAIDKSGELSVKEDPRAFTHKPVGQRMIIVSAGVVMNLIFAALAFMVVFMIGVDVPPAEVGLINPGSPADYAGFRPGDRILEINGKEIRDFTQLHPAVMLADPNEPMPVKISRPGPDGKPTIETVEIIPTVDPDLHRLQLGIAPPMNNRVVWSREQPALTEDQQIEFGDRIIEIDGQPVDNFAQIRDALLRARGEWLDMKVRRPRDDGDDRLFTTRLRAHLVLRTTGDFRRDSGDLLGLVPRRMISIVNEDSRADLAGLEPGDVITGWGGRSSPTIAEILDSIKENPEQDIRVTVLRRLPDGTEETHTLQVRPKPPGLFGTGSPKVGMDPYGVDENHLVVADIVPEVNPDIRTPAAGLQGVLLRGSLITKVNGEPVHAWQDLADRFIKHAGSDVEITWTYQGQPEQSAKIHVPQTLGTTFDLPPNHRIVSIAGQRHVTIEKNGKPETYAVSHWSGAMEVLRTRVGKTIEVQHKGLTDPTVHTETVTITEEMLNTWVMRIEYEMIEDLLTEPVMVKFRETNPVKAMMIGVEKTYYFIEQVYMMMRRMFFTRSLEFDQVSGPVGIVNMGRQIAEQDLVKLLYFLALISANLAVINFLPLPIVDGGLFVFLIIEKIKGSPISLKVQIVTQAIGLALIIGIFLYVTIQDIFKMM